MATEIARSYTSGSLPPGPHEDLSLETKVDSRAALRDRIFAAADHIRNHPHNISSATESLFIRAENCIATGGGHFEQVL